MPISIYCDGACSVKDRIGGWGVFIEDGIIDYGFSGAKEDTTNNEMELTAFLFAVEWIRDNNVKDASTIYCDSAYITNCFEDEWYIKWQKNGWLNAKKEPVKHRELWEKIIAGLNGLTVRIQWVKGHAENRGNQQADARAVQAKMDLYHQLGLK